MEEQLEKQEKDIWIISLFIDIVSLVIDKNTAAHFDAFGTEYILQEVLNKIKDKSVTRDILRMQDHGSIVCGFFFVAFK